MESLEDERREPGREDIEIDYDHLKHDVTEFDDDDNDEVEHKTNMSRYGWCPCCEILQCDGRPSIVALRAATLLTSPFVELVLRERSFGGHATNGVFFFFSRPCVSVRCRREL